ncbi:hypothetical protein Bca4012_086952 [Brassica carinata]
MRDAKWASIQSILCFFFRFLSLSMTNHHRSQILYCFFNLLTTPDRHLNPSYITVIDTKSPRPLIAVEPLFLRWRRRTRRRLATQPMKPTKLDFWKGVRAPCQEGICAYKYQRRRDHGKSCIWWMMVKRVV